MSARRLANGARTSYAYDLADRPLRIAHVTSASVTLAKFDYRYDPVGNRTRVVESATDVVT